MTFRKMIEKEFKINDILNAINSISKIETKKAKIIEIKNKINIPLDFLEDQDSDLKSLLS